MELWDTDLQLVTVPYLEFSEQEGGGSSDIVSLVSWGRYDTYKTVIVTLSDL